VLFWFEQKLSNSVHYDESINSFFKPM